MYLEKITNSKSKFFLAVIISFILGVGLASLCKLTRSDGRILGLVLIAGFLFWLMLKIKKWRMLMALVIFLFLGMWRFILSEPLNQPQNLRFYSERIVFIKGKTVGQGEISGAYQRIYFNATGIKFSVGDDYQKVKGKTIVYLDKYPLYNYGETMEIRCNLVSTASLDKSDGFSYANYLNKEKIWVACFNAQIIKNHYRQEFDFYKIFFDLKNFFNQKINYLLPEPHSSFLRGLLYGDRGNMPKDLNEAFNRTGITHIVAISGYNITIIVVGLLAFCQGLRISGRRAFFIAVFLIAFFVLLTGASASVCRAGVMGVLVLWGRRLGRASAVGRILILSAFLMLLINPRLLLFDAGFQLSFLATIGLVYFAPILEKRVLNLPDRFGLKEIIVTTFSAIIFTLPLIVYLFGRFSVIAPLANLLILPAVPLSMLSGFITLLVGMIYLPLGQLLAYLSWMILSYIIKMAEFLSLWQFSSLNLFLPLWLMILLYFILFYAIYYNYKKNKI